MSVQKYGFKSIALGTTSAIGILVGVLITTTAEAQTDPANGGGTELVVVTGVRGAPRSATDSPTPVDVVSGAELTDIGQADLYRNLSTAIPSFDRPQSSGAATAAVVQTGGLRGLDPDQTLVLVDGLRFHHTALINVSGQVYNGSDPVDLGMLPIAGVDHIEVLRDGAGAQYGSDAVAGVINVITKKNGDGGSISAQYGQNWDRGDGQLLRVQGDYGFDYSNTGSVHLFAASVDQAQANRAVPIGSPYSGFLPAGSDLVVFKGYGQDPSNQLQFGYTAHDEIGGVEIYTLGVLNARQSWIPYPGVYNLNVDLPQVYPSIFNPNFKIRELDGQAAIGARGILQGWNWDISSTFGEDNARESVSHDINASLGPSSPTSFYLGTLDTQEWVNSLDVTRKFDVGSGGSLQASWGLQHRLETFQQSAGDLSSYVVGGYQIPTTQQPTYPGQSSFAGQYPTPGAYYTPGFTPQDAKSVSRNVFAAYGELGYEPTEKLSIDFAGRVEDFSDTSGASAIGKVDGRYKLTDWFTLRASIGNGFHAPSLAQQNYSQTKATLNAATNVITTSALLPASSPTAQALGATPLQPETSTDMSVGFTLTPTSDFTLTTDGYVVNVYRRIDLPGLLSGAGVSNILSAAGLQSNISGNYFTNGINTQTAGLDTVATYHGDLGNWGDLKLTAAFNLNNTAVTRVVPNPQALSSLGTSYVLFDAAAKGFITSALPKSKLVLGGNWSWNIIDVDLHEVRYGDFSAITDVVANNRTFDAAWITYLDVKLHVTDRFSFAVGANNLFNVYPPATNIAAPQYGFNQYNRLSPYGITGGAYYARVQVDL